MNYEDYLTAIRKPMVNVDASNKCIVQCSLCERHAHPKELATKKINESGDISIANVKKLVKYFDMLNFCGTISDAIYHRNFLDILACLDKNKYYRVNTNGSGKKLKWYKQAYELSGPHVEWAFSLDGTGESSAIYRINQNTQQTWGAMLLAREMDIRVIWKFVVFKFNEHQIDEAIELSKTYGFKFELVKSTRWPPKGEWLKPSDEWLSLNTDNDRQQYT